MVNVRFLPFAHGSPEDRINPQKREDSAIRKQTELGIKQTESNLLYKKLYCKRKIIDLRLGG